MRLDLYLIKQYPEYSRALLQSMVKTGKVTVNGVTVTKVAHRTLEDDKVTLDYQLYSPDSTDLHLPVVYEDTDCVVIDKPVGLLTHSKGALNNEGTVATWLRGRQHFAFSDEAKNVRAGIVHRLDRATSGVMICAKNPVAQSHLQKQFQTRKAKKTYIARIDGILKPSEAIIDLPIERNPKQPSKFRVGQNGKPAQTIYRVIKTLHGSNGREYSLVELSPITGRTHQLRVHLNYLKHPIFGDTFYGGAEAERLFLHAKNLEITLTNSSRQTFEADLPEIFYEAGQ